MQLSRSIPLNPPRRLVWQRIVRLGAAMGLFLVAGLVRLDGPAEWWDGGWTQMVARTWVERGVYARLLDGKPVPPGLEAAFPTTASVALSFRLLGVGVWQARLPILLSSLGAVTLLFFLTARLYNPRIAVGAVAVLMLMCRQPELHPLVMGRRVMAEMPMLLFLVGGYLVLLIGLSRSLALLPCAALLWAAGLLTKAQPLPFWLCSLLLPLLLALVQRQWRAASALGGTALLTVVLYRMLPSALAMGLGGSVGSQAPLPNLYFVTAVVPVLRYRVFALQIMLFVGFPTLCGLIHATRSFWRARLEMRRAEHVLKAALLTFAGSWCAWWLLLSSGSVRYLLPVTFVGSMFTAALLDALTSGFRPLAVLRVMAGAAPSERSRWQRVVPWLAIGLLALNVPATVEMLAKEYTSTKQADVTAVAAWLHTHTPPDALVETYEAELFYLLDRSYHYPPDQYHVELMERTMWGRPVSTTYDPLAADPDYLVADMQSEDWKPYDRTFVATHFRRIEQVGRFDIYARRR